MKVEIESYYWTAGLELNGSMIKYEISIVSLLHKNEVSIPCTQEISRDLRDFHCMPCTLTTWRWRRTTPATRWTSVRRQWRLPRQVPFYNFKTDSWASFLKMSIVDSKKLPKAQKNHFWPSYNIQIRAQKGEDEVADLDAKAKQLETELDLTAEKLGYVSLQVKTFKRGLSLKENFKSSSVWVCEWHSSQ